MFEQASDPPALLQDGAARNFGWMGGEYGDDLYLAQQVKRLIGADSCIAHSEQRPAKGAGKRGLICVKPGGAAAALAMVGFREIGQFEIDGESFGDPIGLLSLELADNLLRLAHLIVEGVRSGGGVDSRLDQQAAKLLDSLEEVIASLLNQYAAEQYPERTDIAAQGMFLGAIVCAGGQFDEPRALVPGSP
jgi:hypothetical protein